MERALNQLELAARVAWMTWGEAYAKFTACGCCGEIKWCRGPRPNRMLCVDCFDQTGGK